MSTNCTICGTKVSVPADAKVGELIDCDNCGVELELRSLEPVSVGVFEEEEK